MLQAKHFRSLLKRRSAWVRKMGVLHTFVVQLKVKPSISNITYTYIQEPSVIKVQRKKKWLSVANITEQPREIRIKKT